MSVPPSGARRDAEVVVVGAGPAGSAVAAFLARAGVDVLLLDRARFPRDKPCAEYLSPQASRLLEELGVLHQVEAAGAAQLRGMRVRAPNGAQIVGDFAASHGFRGFRDRGLALRRLVLDEILLRAAESAGARVMQGATVRSLVRDERGRVVGVTADGEAGTVSIEASLVIGADGLRSVVGRRAGLVHAGRWPRRVALVTHYTGIDSLGDYGEMHVADRNRGYIGIAHVGGGVANVALVTPTRMSSTDMHGDPASFLESWIATMPHLVERFRSASRVTPIRAVGPFNVRARTGWAPGVALVGDAADFFDPFTGEGIYTALRGAELLSYYAFHAVRSGAQDQRRADVALRAYDRARKHEFRGKWRVERLIGGAVAFPWVMNRVARSLAERRDMADLLVGVVGDFVPASEVLRSGYVARLFAPGVGGRIGEDESAGDRARGAPPESQGGAETVSARHHSVAAHRSSDAPANPTPPLPPPAPERGVTPPPWADAS